MIVWEIAAASALLYLFAVIANAIVNNISFKAKVKIEKELNSYMKDNASKVLKELEKANNSGKKATAKIEINPIVR